MNIANKLTLARVALIPVFIVFFYLKSVVPLWNYYAALVFVVASLTDLFDGALARKRGIVTNFGKLLDPIADKLLVSSALILLTAMGWVHELIVIVIVGREFIVSGLRLVAAAEGKVLAADSWGKAKTVVQIVAVVFVLLQDGWIGNWVIVPGFVLMCIGALLAVISCVGYFVKNKAVVKELFS